MANTERDLENVLTPTKIRTYYPSQTLITQENLKAKLLWMSWLRVATLIVLVLATIIITLETSVVLGTMREFLIWLGLIFLVPATLQFPLIYTTSTLEGLIRVALIQIIQDNIFSSAIVVATGGTGSAFTFFFSLTVIVSGILIGRRGTIVSIVTASLLMVIIACIEANYIEGLSLFDFMPTTYKEGSNLYPLGLNIVAFVGIGVLSSYLTEQIRLSDIQRERFRIDLEDLRQLHEAILASLDVGIITCDLKWKIIHVNRAAEKLIGLKLSQIKNKTLEVVLPQSKELFDKDNIQTEITFSAQRRLILRMKHVFLLSAVGEKVGRIIIIEDITLLKEMEEKMKADEKLTMVGRLSAMVAHEIRNPLAAISASTQMLAMRNNFREKDKHILDILVRETERLNRWISDLLDYARPTKTEIMDVDVEKLISDVLDVAKNDPMSAEITFETKVEPHLSVWGDPFKLHRVFLNLVKNAMESIEKNGKIEIVASLDGDNQMVEFKVVDNGKGIPPEDIDKVFEPFYTTKTRGTGLGLTVVSHIISEHQGTISVRSIPQMGTEFTIRLKGSKRPE